MEDIMKTYIVNFAPDQFGGVALPISIMANAADFNTEFRSATFWRDNGGDREQLIAAFGNVLGIYEDGVINATGDDTPKSSEITTKVDAVGDVSYRTTLLQDLLGKSGAFRARFGIW
jgi:hypothetical protein